jgi:hypothetical protein
MLRGHQTSDCTEHMWYSLRQADRGPCEDRRETRDREKPREDGRTGSSDANIRNRAPQEQKDDGIEGTTRFINVCEGFRSVALLGHGQKRARACVYAAQADG